MQKKIACPIKNYLVFLLLTSTTLFSTELIEKPKKQQREHVLSPRKEQEELKQLYELNQKKFLDTLEYLKPYGVYANTEEAKKELKLKEALRLLIENPSLVNAQAYLDKILPLEVGLQFFNQKSIATINGNGDYVEFVKILIYESLYQNRINPLNGAHPEVIKKFIATYVTRKENKEVAFHLLDWASQQLDGVEKKHSIKNETIPEDLTIKLFFEKVADANPNIAVFLRNHPEWTDKLSEKKYSVLEVVLMNYSQAPEEKELIQTVITLNPWILLPLKEKQKRIDTIIATFAGPIALEMKNLLHSSIKAIKNKKFAVQDKKRLLKEYPLIAMKNRRAEQHKLRLFLENKD